MTTTQPAMQAIPETLFAFVREWFVKARDRAKERGANESYVLWNDGLQHLDRQREVIAELVEKLQWAEDMIDNLRKGKGCFKTEGDDCQRACVEAISKAKELL